MQRLLLLFKQQLRNKTIRANAPTPTIQKSPLLESPTSPDLAAVDKDSSTWYVKRIPKSGFLPVYRQYKNGRSRSVTVIRRIEGSLADFKEHLAAFIPSDRIRVGQNKVQINGDYSQHIRDWLTLNKF